MPGGHVREGALPHRLSPFLFFFFNDTATTEIYTLSLHDALPISTEVQSDALGARLEPLGRHKHVGLPDRKSTRLNSSHVKISYAVFYMKKKYYNKSGYLDDITLPGYSGGTPTHNSLGFSSFSGSDIIRFQTSFFFFNDTATTEIYTLSLHDALPISWLFAARLAQGAADAITWVVGFAL